MTKFISEECYNDIMEMAAQMVAEAILNNINEGKNLLRTAIKYGASKDLKKRAYEQPSDTDAYGEYDNGPITVKLATPKGRGLDTKNGKGQLHTDLRHSSYGELLDLKREMDAKQGYKSATKKSIERHIKKVN